MTLRQAKRIPRNELIRRIEVAANQIGLTDLVMREWDRNLLDSWFTDGVVREKKNDNGSNHYRMYKKVDIGYLERDRVSGDYTVDSFSINPLAFSKARSEEFAKELVKQGLRPGEFSPFGGIFPDPEEQRELRERDQNAIYR